MKNKKVIIGFILLLAIVVDLVFVFGFQASRMTGAEKTIKEMKSKIQSFDNEVVRKSDFLKNKAELENEIMLTETRFMGKDDVAYILSELNATAKKLNVEIKNIRLEKTVDAGGSHGVNFYYLPVSVRFTIGYHQLGSFFNILEKKEIPIRLKSAKISGQFPEMFVDAIVMGVAKGN